MSAITWPSLLRAVRVIFVVVLMQNGCGDQPSPVGEVEANPFLPLPGMRLAWLREVSFAAARELPTTPSLACEMVTFIISLQPFTGLPGHSAIAIGSEFHDFGPKPTNYKAGMVEAKLGGIAQWPAANLEGARWWSELDREVAGQRVWDPARFQTYDDINLTAVLDHLEAFMPVDGDMTALAIPIEVSKAHAARIIQWWEHFYANMPRFTIPGTHCTSTVIRSFQETDPDAAQRDFSHSSAPNWQPAFTAPLAFAARLLDTSSHGLSAQPSYRHQCGAHQGEPLRAAILRLGADMRNHGLEERLLASMATSSVHPLWFTPSPKGGEPDRSP